jgi:glycosyltransferase involved in cell wall biosynthesis
MSKKNEINLPIVSVVIPTWNRASTLKTAIQSALDQTDVSVEVLVCDDGSDDDSERIVADFTDPRVRWLPGQRSGLPAVARNRGMRAARGDWVAFLDSDDEWYPSKLAKQLELAHNLSVGAVSTNAHRFVPGEDFNHELLLSWGKDLIRQADLVQCNWVICSSMLAKRSVLSEAMGFPESRNLRAIEDFALWLRVSSVTDIAFLATAQLRYRDEPNLTIRGAEKSSFLQVQKKVLWDYLKWSFRSRRLPEILILRTFGNVLIKSVIH